MTTEPDDARRQIRATVDALATTTRLEVHLGAFHDDTTHEHAQPVAVVDDPAVIADVLDALAGADPGARAVPYTLDGLAVIFQGDEEYLGTVRLLSPRWVRSDWAYDAELARDVLTDVIASLPSPPWDPRTSPAIDAAVHGDSVPSPVQGRWLAGTWDARWPDHPPISHLLPRGADARWVRFHSLPHSQRYPDHEEQYLELLMRHRTALAELSAAGPGATPEVVVVTSSWASSSQPVPRSQAVAATMPRAQYWMSVLTDCDPDARSEAWTHLFVDVVPLDDPGLELLLRLVADDRTGNVLVLASDLSWVYAPYDGGADVYAPTAHQRDELAAAHHQWLPATDGGL